MRRIASLSIGIAALALGACQGPTTPLDSHELAVAAQQVASLAGEAEWLAQQLESGSVTANYASVHQHALGEDAAKVSRDIATQPVPRQLQPARESLAAINGRLQSQVTRLAGAAGHDGELDALQREFHQLAEQARPMGREP
jgi:N-acetyl-beta-hexosaminidase